MCTGPHDFIPALNTAKLELVYTAFGQIVENVVHMTKGSRWEQGELQALAEGAASEWSTTLADLAGTSVTLSLVRATDLGEENGFGVEFAPTSSNTGLDDSPTLPLGTTVATKFTTGRTGRSYRGRAYFVGLTGSDITGNSLSSGKAAAISNAWSTFFSELSHVVDGSFHSIVSYCQNKEWLTSAVISLVTGYSTDPFIDSQRRRLTGRGQ